MTTIVMKPNLGVDPAKRPGLGSHGLTWIKLRKLKKKIFEILINYMKKIKK
jgi:hypothetical protein